MCEGMERTPPPPTHALNSTGRTEANFVRGWGSLPHNTHFDWQDRTPKEDREANIAGVMPWHVVVARNGCRVHVVANNGCR